MNEQDIAAAADLDIRLTILGRCECGAVRDVREIADYPHPGTTYLEPYCPGCGTVPGFDDPLANEIEEES